jgi:hypothetical protein
MAPPSRADEDRGVTWLQIRDRHLIGTTSFGMLISHYRHLEMKENVPLGEEMILRGATERLSPIL